MRILDFQDNGLGDVILGCWIVNSAHHAGEEVFINPRRHLQAAELLNVPSRLITSLSGGNWTQIKEGGFMNELEHAHLNPKTRFDFWVESLGLSPLEPVRPIAVMDDARMSRGREEWSRISVIEGAPKIILFPEATRETRKWPLIHWLNLVALLKEKYNVCVMTTDRKAAQSFDCFRYWGQPFHALASLIKNADFVISADSGAAHLASTLEIPTFCLFGPTIGKVVFGHEPHAYPISTDQIDCIGCNFSPEMGYRKYCNTGCLALHLLAPNAVLETMEEIIAGLNTPLEENLNSPDSQAKTKNSTSN